MSSCVRAQGSKDAMSWHHSPFGLLSARHKHVGGAHEGAPLVDGVLAGQDHGIDGSAGHEGHQALKEGLALVLSVKLLCPLARQLQQGTGVVSKCCSVSCSRQDALCPLAPDAAWSDVKPLIGIAVDSSRLLNSVSCSR